MFEFAKEFIVGACDQIYQLSGTSHGADKLTKYWKIEAKYFLSEISLFINISHHFKGY